MEKVELKVGEGTQEIILREGQANNTFQYDGFHHVAYSTPSFILLVKEKANADNAVIAYGPDGMKAIMDDTVIDRRQDTVTYEFQVSQQYSEWEVLLQEKGIVLTQEQIVNFLKRREEGELEGIEDLIISLKQFKYATNISGEAMLEDNNNYTCAIKVGGVEGTTKLPKVICPEIEIYNESGFKQSIEIEIETILPKSSEEKIAFKFSCPKIERYMKEAVNHEVEKLKSELTEYLIITGEI